MPNLPTVSVTQAQADRILLAFGGDVAVAVPAYKEWLIRQVRAYVLDQAKTALVVTNYATDATALSALNADLPLEPPTSPMP